MKRILLMTFGLSIFLWADFTRNDANGIVTDNTTTLEWQDVNIDAPMRWEDAIAYCEDLNLQGKGWRLPNINELKTIIDDSNVSPAIVDVFVSANLTKYYWSSTTYEGSSHKNAWNVNFTTGAIYNKEKNTTTIENLDYVRCVRGKQ